MATVNVKMQGGTADDHELEDAPLTILCHKGDATIKPVDAMELNTEFTRYHGNIIRAKVIDSIALKWIEYILGYELGDDKPEDRHPREQHIIGMVDLPIKLMQIHKRGIPFFFREPETFLHPAQQARMADFFCQFSTKTTDEGVFTETPEAEES